FHGHIVPGWKSVKKTFDTAEELEIYIKQHGLKLIDEAQGDENKLYDLFIQKLAERHTRPAIVEY
ncbi:hypothetical protein U3A_01869, partial [Staphylococcus aureus M0719]